MVSRELAGVAYYRLDWAEVEELAWRLCGSIERCYRPDIVVGLLRGGGIVAHMVSDRLGMNEIYLVGCRSYEGIGRRSTLKIYQPLVLKSLKGKDVLLVDDVADTGRTLVEASSMLRQKNPRRLRTATLLVKPHTDPLPDFFVDKVDAWIVYPWEKYEIVRQIAPILYERLGEGAIRELRDFVGIDENFIREVSKASSGNDRPLRP
ncbi:MAG: phosphoribosyltransferase [Aigarchaeota archaeon]|nr:phosphoribosyltransferase [Aigarchaeota archaeon]